MNTQGGVETRPYPNPKHDNVVKRLKETWKKIEDLREILRSAFFETLGDRCYIHLDESATIIEAIADQQGWPATIIDKFYRAHWTVAEKDGFKTRELVWFGNCQEIAITLRGNELTITSHEDLSGSIDLSLSQDSRDPMVDAMEKWAEASLQYMIKLREATAWKAKGSDEIEKFDIYFQKHQRFMYLFLGCKFHNIHKPDYYYLYKDKVGHDSWWGYRDIDLKLKEFKEYPDLTTRHRFNEEFEESIVLTRLIMADSTM